MPRGFTQHHFYYLYILQSKLHEQIYVGSTNDLKTRIIEHNNGKQISTKRYKPWNLLYYEAYRREDLARERENKLKHHGNAIRELKRRIGIFKSGAGFTLIELVLVIAIVGILAGLGIPSYSNFKKNQDLEQASQTLMTDLRFAQSQAAAGVKPTSCGAINELIGWYVKFQANKYDIFVRCGTTSTLNKSIVLPSAVTESLSFSADVVFQPIGKEVVFVGNAQTATPPFSSLANELTIGLTNNTKIVGLVVRRTGDIGRVALSSMPGPEDEDYDIY